jgi:uncharacterized protein (TIGR00725 family)
MLFNHCSLWNCLQERKKAMETRKKIRIGVIGGSRPQKKFLHSAFEIGKLVAGRDAILVCGGLGGVMEETARGAKQAGGLTIGILPGNNPADANPYIDIPIATGLGYTRNSLVAMNADVLIAIDGEYGTLSEIAYGRIYGKKVIGLGTWDIEGILPAASPEEAVELAFR